MTYPLLCAGFLAVALGIRAFAEARARARGRRIPWRPTIIAGAVLFMLTAVFDNLMISAGLFHYADALTSGIRIGAAPLEDFAYPVAAVLLIPAFEELLPVRRDG